MVIKAQFYQTRLLRQEAQTASISSLFFEIPKEYPHFQPGQVVYLRALKEAGSPQQAAKPYCICSLYEDGKIELCVDQVNAQGISGQLTQAGAGESFQISLPAGKFTLPLGLKQPLLLVGLGSGIGVLRGMMRQANREPQSPNIQFYAVNTDETAIPFEADLEAVSERFRHIQVYPILQTNGFDTDEIGDRILSHVEDLKGWAIFMAGPAEPLEVLRKELVSLGAHPKQFHVEGYV